MLAVEKTGSGVVVGAASSACGHAVYSSLMYLLPYAKVTLRSALPPDDFVGRLSHMVAPPKLWFRWPWDPCDQEFEGEVNGRNFEISRVRKFQAKSFVIQGRIDPDVGGGSSVCLVMRPTWAVAAGMTIGMALILVVGLVAAISMLARGTRSGHEILMVCSPVYGYLVCIVPFVLEVRKALELLEPLGEPVKGEQGHRLVRD